MKYNFDCEECDYQMEVDLTYKTEDDGIHFELENEEDATMECPICGESHDVETIMEKNQDSIFEMIEAELAEQDSSEHEFWRSQHCNGRD